MEGPSRTAESRRFRVWLLVSVALLATGPVAAGTIHVAPAGVDAATGDGSAKNPYRDLQEAVDAARRQMTAGQPGTESLRGVTIRLAAGEYHLTPAHGVEPTCGNCEEPATPVPITVGLEVSGRSIRIIGADAHGSRIQTHAGYGILFRDCDGCALEGVVVTGGERDTSGRATDAAIVVQNSTVEIENCEIRDNIGDPALIEANIVGIMGITGREGARMRISGNRILRNSWDGIALYRGAEAEITGNVIDGIDLATGRTAGGGRGVGIGITWNGKATIRGNLVRRYWKGIGLFVDAQGTVEENIVEQIATWGLSLWDAGKGRPQGVFRWNVVDSTGACGAMLLRESTDPPDAGELTSNAFVRTGQNPKYDDGEPYCLQAAVALHAAPEGFPIRGNHFFANREAAGSPGSGDVPREEFRRGIELLLGRLARWPNLAASGFWKEFGEGDRR